MIVKHVECGNCGRVISPTTHNDSQCSAKEGGTVVMIGGTWRCMACDAKISGKTSCSECGWSTKNWEDYGYPTEMDESEL
jgi:hypothetical protein